MSATFIKGMNYTQKINKSKTGQETVQYWVLAKIRKPDKCGVWVDGKQVANYYNMKNYVVPKPLNENCYREPLNHKDKMEEKPE
jgi:hypothetical protein